MIGLVCSMSSARHACRRSAYIGESESRDRARACAGRGGRLLRDERGAMRKLSGIAAQSARIDEWTRGADRRRNQPGSRAGKRDRAGGGDRHARSSPGAGTDGDGGVPSRPGDRQRRHPDARSPAVDGPRRLHARRQMWVWPHARWMSMGEGRAPAAGQVSPAPSRCGWARLRRAWISDGPACARAGQLRRRGRS